MCGIAGIVGAAPDAAASFVRRANDLQAHRGPDDEGTWEGAHVALGHRRLAILDLTPAAGQPMLSPDGRVAIAYNGEVYNHLELRQRFLADVPFRSRSDTETVLHLLCRKGPEALPLMVGMWSILLWDGAAQRLFVSRDRYGQKPLYWRRYSDGSMAFSSEIKPLLQDGEKPEPDRASLADYLATGNYGHLGSRTFFRDVRAFPAGHWAVVTPGDTEPAPRAYWRFPAERARTGRTLTPAAVEELGALVRQAVSSQLMSDVPVGATLSGGLDSSIVVGAACSEMKGPVLTAFTAQVPGSRYDETRYVAAVQQHWKEQLNIHTTTLAAASFRPALVETIRQQEEPFGDPSIVAHGFLMDAARAAGIPVILGGQGADEVFLGYRHMQFAAIASGLRQGRIGWACAQLAGLDGSARALPRVVLAAALPPVEQRVRQQARKDLGNWLGPALAGERPSHSGVKGWGDWRTVWMETIEGVALPHLVHYDDRSAMARSVESRMPFLDHRIADFVASLDATAFLRRGYSKWPLREACARLVPREVLERRDKIGFFTPLPQLLRSEAGWIRELVSDHAFVSRRWIHPSLVDRPTVSGSMSRSGVSYRMLITWRTVCAALWAQQFGVSA